MCQRHHRNTSVLREFPFHRRGPDYFANATDRKRETLLLRAFGSTLEVFSRRQR
jgi:hypothetical protein